MAIACNPLKQELIIVAEHEPAAADAIVAALQDNGFSYICRADSGEKIFGHLRPLHDRPETVGLIVLNPNLPNCRLQEFCESLADSANGAGIPILIIGPAGQRDAFPGANLETGLIHCLEQPVEPSVLLLAVNFLLRLKQERVLRQRQEEQLIDELAAKSVIEAKLKFLVAHDELTGLFNRGSFERQLRVVLNMGHRLNKNGSLLFIDIDRFSLINELEGFDVGDRLLVELTLLVRKLVPPNSLFGRIGADEFCLFLDNQNPRQAHTIAHTIQAAVEHCRFFSGETCFSASVSIGISSLDAPFPSTHPGEMILHARQACNFAKQSGRNKISAYSHDDLAVKERKRDIYWLPIIRKALLENELFLVFQPVVELNNGDISHYESLIRMRGEDGLTITPDRFIPVAERMGLIHSIDLWVVEHAIDFLASLPAYLSRISLAINLSGTAFQYPDMLQMIRDKLALTWVEPSRLTFEITETAAVDNFERTRDMVMQIRQLGCKFALDDFGAGFCSFNYLKTFPVDYVKIDGQFIKNLPHNETDRILVKSMVEIAGKLNKKTIAEFVETPDIAQHLRELGVHMGQGFAFGKPEQHLLEGRQISLALLTHDR